MKRTLSYAVCLALFTLACSQSDVPAGTPPRIVTIIERIKQKPVSSPPASIIRYQYQGKDVYFQPAACCDLYSFLYDSEGRILCSPDGGLSGSGDGRCADFYPARTAEQLIWTDTRR